MTVPLILTLVEHDHYFVLLASLDGMSEEKLDRLLPSGSCEIYPREDEGASPSLRVSKAYEGGQCGVLIESFYYVGLDWVIPNKLAVRVVPKINRESKEIDLLGTLRIALTTPENFNQIEGLLTLNPQVPPIASKTDANGLMLFVISQFLTVVGRITRKGLKRSFRDEEETFDHKIKGRILISPSVNIQRSANFGDRLRCRYQTFDTNTLDNRLIKFAVQTALLILQHIPKTSDIEILIEQSRCILRSFRSVPADPFTKAHALELFEQIQRQKKYPVLFKDYNYALDLGHQVLKFETLGVASGVSKDSHVPSHWIDMPKLFELYCFEKLREAMGDGRVEYHVKAHWQELDFLCVLPDDRLRYCVVDAKYKPIYRELGVIKEDARQLAGYSRLDTVINRLCSWGMNDADTIVPCMIIYADQLAGMSIDWNLVEEINGWRRFYKIGIKMPEKC